MQFSLVLFHTIPSLAAFPIMQVCMIMKIWFTTCMISQLIMCRSKLTFHYLVYACHDGNSASTSTFVNVAASPSCRCRSSLGGAIFCTSVRMYAPCQFKFSGSSSGSKTMACVFYLLVPRNNRNLTRLVKNSNMLFRKLAIYSIDSGHLDLVDIRKYHITIDLQASVEGQKFETNITSTIYIVCRH